MSIFRKRRFFRESATLATKKKRSMVRAFDIRGLSRAFSSSSASKNDPTLIKDRRPLIRTFTIFSLYIYIASIYVLSYSEKYSSLSRVMFIALLGFTLMDLVMNNVKLHFDTTTVLMILFIAYSLLSILWVVSTIGVDRSTKMFLHVAALYFVLRVNIRSMEDVRTVLNAVIAGTLLMCAYTLYHYGFGEIIRAITVGKIRIGDEVNQSNGMGMYCAILIVSMFYLILYERRYYYIAFMPLALFIQLGCASRRGFAMLAVGLIIVAFFRVGNKKVIFLLVVAAIMVMIYNFIVIMAESNYFFYRILQLISIFGRDSFADHSVVVRQKMIEMGLKMFAEKPIQGYGPLQFEYYYGLLTGIRRPPHSTYIQILVSYGLIGAVLYYSNYVYFLKNIFSFIRKKISFTPLMLAFCAMIFINDFGANMLVQKYMYLLLALIAGFIYQAKKQVADAEKEAKPPISTS